MHLGIQASSLTQALESMSVNGKPVIGETLNLNVQVSLQVDENLLDQLRRSQNIKLVFKE